MKRREFLKNSIFIPAAGVTLFYTLSSCSSDDPAATTTTGTQPVGTCTAVTAAIGSNHGHTIVPPSVAEVNAMAAITLSLTVGGGHPHTVALTSQHLSDISTCASVAVATSVDSGHAHTVTFTGA